MKPVVREYTNDELLKEDVKKLQVQGVDAKDIYVLSHDDERTNRVANNADANTIGIKEMGLGTAASNLFNKKGDELRHKLSEVGLSKTEAEMYEEKLDQGKVLVIVTNNETVRL
ncbi:general stress protein [Priestia filamentosa]|uniref:General stress protein n=1 Tax=Priestia filamentosa TaxID=1402861 RepID=A0A1X7FRJ1_9BACI|nr:general stress protein [Priestia filamentosa]AKO94737.1 general stress protein [Priestia filamentosa]MDT3765055.1 general stress protein [Priestia filamentosa]OXS66764.1 general stress protein [Priestia filamentosa]RJS66152.1 general stress protein [Priestia filamentosa]WCM15642.1 general stress protein [Priestia filamentosa]